MEDLKVLNTVVVLPSISIENSRDFYIKNLGFKLSPNGNVENGNLSINFTSNKVDNYANNGTISLDECRVVLQYKDLSLIDCSKFEVLEDIEVPYGRFIYIKDVSGNLICLSELYNQY